MPRPKKETVASTSKRAATPSSRSKLDQKRTKLDPTDYLPKTLGDRVLSCGEGGFGQIGHGEDLTESLKPRKIDTLPQDVRFVQVAAGDMHSLALTADKRIFTCGANENGTVPVGEDDDVFEFTHLDLTSFEREHGKPAMITAGASISAALTDKGSVIAWGYLRDESGNLSNHKNLSEMYKSPTVILSYKQHQAVKVVAGGNHFAVLDVEGHLHTLGCGQEGQLGRVSRRSLDHVRGCRSMDGTAMCKVVAGVGVHRVERFRDVWAGAFWTMALGEDGKVYGFGLNNYEQLGLDNPEMEEGGTKTSIITYPANSDIFNLPLGQSWIDFDGDHHLLALSSQKELYGIGRNTDNRLGLGTYEARTADSDEMNWKLNTLERIAPDKNFVGCSAGNSGSIAWDEQGVAWAWGCDSSGQLGLGLGDNATVAIPQQVKSKHLDGFKIVQVSVADQHSLFLASAQTKNNAQ